MLSRYKSYFERPLFGLARSLRWIHPNVLTLVGIIPYVLFFIFMQRQQYELAAFSLAFSVIDVLDGLIARATSRTSAFGAFFDSTVDRVSDFLMIAGLYAGGLTNLTLAATLVLLSFLISYTKARFEGLAPSKKFDYGLIERPERVILVIIAVILHQFNFSYFVILILTLLSAFTVIQRVWHAYKNL